MNRIEINVVTGERKVVELTQSEIDRLPPPPSDAEIKEQYIQSVSDALQSVMDEEAKAKGYDSIHTAVTYADEPANATFQADGQSFRAWRSLVWAYAYATLGQYEADLLAYPILKQQYNDDVVQYDLDKTQYDLDITQYNTDKTQYDIDIAVEPAMDPIPTEPELPIEPATPIAPVKVIALTLEYIVSNSPTRQEV